MDAEEVGVVRADLLSGDFGGGVGRNRADYGIGLGKRNLLIDPIDGGGGGEDEPVDTVAAAGVEQVKSPVDIGGEIQLRILNGRADSGTGGDVEDGIEVAVCEEFSEQSSIADIRADEGDAVAMASMFASLIAGS